MHQRPATQAHAQLLMALRFAVGPSFEVVIAGDKDGDDTRTMLAELARSFLPNTVLHLRPPGKDPAIASVAQYVEPFVQMDAKATVYVCSGFSCRAPTTSLHEMLQSLGLESADPKKKQSLPGRR